MRKPKIKVYIREATGDFTVVKRQVAGNRVILKASKKGLEWAPYFETQYINYVPSRIFKILPTKTKTLIVKRDAEECIDLSKEPAEIPSWDRRSLEKAAEATVVKASGATQTKMEIPTLLYIILAVLIVLGVLTLLAVGGTISLG